LGWNNPQTSGLRQQRSFTTATGNQALQVVYVDGPHRIYDPISGTLAGLSVMHGMTTSSTFGSHIHISLLSSLKAFKGDRNISRQQPDMKEHIRREVWLSFKDERPKFGTKSSVF